MSTSESQKGRSAVFSFPSVLCLRNPLSGGRGAVNKAVVKLELTRGMKNSRTWQVSVVGGASLRAQTVLCSVGGSLMGLMRGREWGVKTVDLGRKSSTSGTHEKLIVKRDGVPQNCMDLKGVPFSSKREPSSISSWF